MINPVRVELVETPACQIKGFDWLSPNGSDLFSASPVANQLEKHHHREHGEHGEITGEDSSVSLRDLRCLPAKRNPRHAERIRGVHLTFHRLLDD